MIEFRVNKMAELLDVHRNTITNWIKSGKLKAAPSVAKRYIVSKEELTELFREEGIPAELIEKLKIANGIKSNISENFKDIKEFVEIKKKTLPKKPIGSVMVVGGGITGIQAGLDLADSGYYVHIVEKSSAVGGVMPKIDKTFPTDDCAMCIVSPKLVKCVRHFNINLLTLSEVVGVSGDVGNFTVKIKKNPRYIDINKCISCGICSQKCPKKVDDEFNEGLSRRKAAYIKFPQAVPLKYSIDGANCIYLTRNKCRACEKFCPTGAINFDEQEEILNYNVGAIILAPGLTTYDPSGLDFYNYKNMPDVVTNLEFERLLSASGPCFGHLKRPSDNKEPGKIAWIQCVGSRNINRCDNGYCSSVCCSVAIKQAITSSHHCHGENGCRTIFYNEIRAHGKELEKYYENARDMGIRFLKAMPHSIEPAKDDSGAIIRYMTEDGSIFNENFDMVVLSVGMEVSPEIRKISDIFKINVDKYGFAATESINPVESSRPGVFVAGTFTGPKAIPKSVIDASAAACEVAKILIEAKDTKTHEKIYPEELVADHAEPRTGVFICSCGINIADVIDVSELSDYAKKLPGVVYVENNLFTCSADTQALISGKIKEFNLNRIVVAACSPLTHEILFQETLKEAGINPYLIEMANIRNQNAWVHQNQPELATQKAKDQLCMAVTKVSKNYPLFTQSVPVHQKALVIGGGIAGMSAALSLADQRYDTFLIERDNRLGGNAWNLERTNKGEAVRPILEYFIENVENHPQIKVLKNARLKSFAGSVGNFVSEVESNGIVHTVDYGVCVIATGAGESIPDEYMFGEDRRVMTQLQFEREMKLNPTLSYKAKSIVFIQCVGSRDSKRPYCSRVCCAHSIKNAIKLKEANPLLDIFILHRDIRTFGLQEELYKKARDLGIIFIRYYLKNKPTVKREGNELYVNIFDPISQQPLRIYTDYIVLATAIEPDQNEELSQLLKYYVNSEGFINEAHPNLAPVELAVEGFFVAGMCNYPKLIDESILQAKAAASRASLILSKKDMQLDAIKSFVTEKCDGCALCVDVCPFKAIKFEEIGDNRDKHKIITVDNALCKGCGLCVATCPKGGIEVHGFTLEQLKSQVHAALNTTEALN